MFRRVRPRCASQLQAFSQIVVPEPDFGAYLPPVGGQYRTLMLQLNGIRMGIGQFSAPVQAHAKPVPKHE